MLETTFAFAAVAVCLWAAAKIVERDQDGDE